MASVTLRDVSKAFGSITVLSGIDLEIADGEFIVLVGPSGCGKSTLLRSIAGLEQVSGGEIWIGDRLVTGIAPKDRDIAMVFQSYALYPHMDVAKNMGFSLALRKERPEVIESRVAAASGKLELGDYLSRLPKHLSGGQRQRVAMGRAIVRSPKAFLFDEPLSNLDARLREQMRAEIKRMHQELGSTSIYVTHDQIEAMTLADRIVAMNAGVIMQTGSPLELYDRPANLFVAGFIGSPAMNMFQGVLRGSTLTAGGTTIRLEKELSVKNDTAVTVGVRPEHVLLGSQADGSLKARVELTEPTGFGTIVHLKPFGETLKAFTLERGLAKLGETIALGFPARSLHLFDTATGARLN
jgi:multiple sugar transport system ATP-binding protein